MSDKNNEVHLGLCQGRHDIKKNDGGEVIHFIWRDAIENIHDYEGMMYQAMNSLTQAYNTLRDWLQFEPNAKCCLYLYVTGLTPALTSTLKAIEVIDERRVMVKLMHYDRDTNTYKEQMWRGHTESSPVHTVDDKYQYMSSDKFHV